MVNFYFIARRCFFVLFPILIVGCKVAIYDADYRMFPEYMEYINITSEGKRAVLTNFKNKRNLTFFYRELEKSQTNVLVLIDSNLKQQYFIFYSNYITSNIEKVKKDNSIELDKNSPLFNESMLNIYLELEGFVTPKANNKMKKVIIGFEGGGAIAHIFSYHLINKLKFDENLFEVITFGMPQFAVGFKPNYNTKNIVLKGDKVAEEKLSCCKPNSNIFTKEIVPETRVTNENKNRIYFESLVREVLKINQNEEKSKKQKV